MSGLCWITGVLIMASMAIAVYKNESINIWNDPSIWLKHLWMWTSFCFFVLIELWPMTCFFLGIKNPKALHEDPPKSAGYALVLTWAVRKLWHCFPKSRPFSHLIVGIFTSYRVAFYLVIYVIYSIQKHWEFEQDHTDAGVCGCFMCAVLSSL